ncbi:MAG: hypothetical protein V4653_20320, partial [Pseudomonadota bacterium]
GNQPDDPQCDDSLAHPHGRVGARSMHTMRAFKPIERDATSRTARSVHDRARPSLRNKNLRLTGHRFHVIRCGAQNRRPI